MRSANNLWSRSSQGWKREIYGRIADREIPILFRGVPVPPAGGLTHQEFISCAPDVHLLAHPTSEGTNQYSSKPHLLPVHVDLSSDNCLVSSPPLALPYPHLPTTFWPLLEQCSTALPISKVPSINCRLTLPNSSPRCTLHPGPYISPQFSSGLTVPNTYLTDSSLPLQSRSRFKSRFSPDVYAPH